MRRQPAVILLLNLLSHEGSYAVDFVFTFLWMTQRVSERERGRTALHPTSALSQRLCWIPQAVAIPCCVTPPWVTSLDMEWARVKLHKTYRYHYTCCNPFPHPVGLLDSKESTRIADKRSWEPKSRQAFWHYCRKFQFLWQLTLFSFLHQWHHLTISHHFYQLWYHCTH